MARAWWLFVPQGFDGVERGGRVGGLVSEEDSHGGGEGERDRGRAA